MTEILDSRRLALVSAAQQRWIAALTDLGGLEERGIRAGYLATGMARWDELFLEPAAPVLLRGLTITPTRARYDDFELILDDDHEVNPVLVHKLTTVFGAELTRLTPENAFDRLQLAADAAEVTGFEITDRRSSAPSPTPSCPWSGTWRRPATCWPKATWWPPSRATRRHRSLSRGPALDRARHEATRHASYPVNSRP